MRSDLKLLIKYSKAIYDRKVKPGTFISKEMGNLYTGSVYAALISLLTSDEQLVLYFALVNSRLVKKC